VISQQQQPDDQLPSPSSASFSHPRHVPGLVVVDERVDGSLLVGSSLIRAASEERNLPLHAPAVCHRRQRCSVSPGS